MRTQDAGYAAFMPYGLPFQTCSPILRPATSRSYNPARASTRSVWAPPRSLAATCGITVVFFSSGYVDVSVPRVGPFPGGAPSARRVPPFGNPRIYGHLPLPAAYRSLSRPSSPLRA